MRTESIRRFEGTYISLDEAYNEQLQDRHDGFWRSMTDRCLFNALRKELHVNEARWT